VTKTWMLGIGIRHKQINDTSSAMGSSTICHKKTHNFSQDAFFNEGATRKKIFTGGSSFSRSIDRPAATHLSIHELYRLAQMNVLIDFGRYMASESE
jgi:hypothetical protein